jgi:hypothetical protein
MQKAKAAVVAALAMLGSSAWAADERPTRPGTAPDLILLCWSSFMSPESEPVTVELWLGQSIVQFGLSLWRLRITTATFEFGEPYMPTVIDRMTGHLSGVGDGSCERAT